MNLSRRRFIESGALVVAFSLLPGISKVKAQAALPGSLNTNRMLNAWLRIDPSGTVTILSGKIELGQGIGTALAQIAADELDVDLKRIALIHGDTELTPNEGQTAGSLSIQQSGVAVRFACAEARELLLAAAAAKLGVPAATSRTNSPAAPPTRRTSGCREWSMAESCVRLRPARSSSRSTRPPRAACRAWSRSCATAASLALPPSVKSRRSARARR